MEHIELVIRLPKGAYDVLQSTGVDWIGAEHILDAVSKGKILPKGHGELITKEQAIELVEFYQMNPQHFNFVDLIDEIKDEKPVIEADKESEVKNDNN